MRDRIRLYGHALDQERARELVDRGFTAMKLFGWRDAVSRVGKLRGEYGPEIDLMVDAGGGRWQTPADAISLGRRLERYGLLFYEDPVSAVDVDGLAGGACGGPADRDRRGVSQPVRAAPAD